MRVVPGILLLPPISPTSKPYALPVPSVPAFPYCERETEIEG